MLVNARGVSYTFGRGPHIPPPKFFLAILGANIKVISNSTMALQVISSHEVFILLALYTIACCALLYIASKILP
jgi:hypothetical protein